MAAGEVRRALDDLWEESRLRRWGSVAQRVLRFCGDDVTGMDRGRLTDALHIYAESCPRLVAAAWRASCAGCSEPAVLTVRDDAARSRRADYAGPLDSFLPAPRFPGGRRLEGTDRTPPGGQGLAERHLARSEPAPSLGSQQEHAVHTRDHGGVTKLKGVRLQKCHGF